jgi:peptidoglycan/LPS O-acetylase OafA/YrhL
VNASNRRFPLVDSMRAIAAISVLTFHSVGLFGQALGPDRWSAPYVGRLELGVTLFFLISGFVLYRPFVVARVTGGSLPDTGAYAWRRALRIVPAYWVALTASVLILALPNVLTASGIPTYYGFAQLYRESTIHGGLDQAWTLCVEVTFYAFLPLWALAIRRLPGRTASSLIRGELWALAALATASLAYNAVLLSTKPSGRSVPAVDPALSALPGYLDQFAIGMTLAVLSVWWVHRDALPAPMRLVERAPSLAWLVAAVVFVLAATSSALASDPVPPFTPVAYAERHVLHALVALALLLPAVVGETRRGGLRRMLGGSFLLWLGALSYGIYLLHLLVLHLLVRWHFGDVAHGHSLAWGAAGLAGSVLLAAISYYLVDIN